MKNLSWVLLALSCVSGVVSAHQAGDVFMRAGAITVRPSEGSDNVLGMGGFNVSNNTQLGLTFDYMLTDNVGVELLAATPFRHRVGLGATGDLATVKQLPPTLMVQWYFGQMNNKVRPYIGAGINYTTFFKTNLNQTGRDAGLTDLSVKNSWGAAGQAGLDYIIDDSWLLNMSLWYMDIDTEVKFKAAGVQQNINTHIDPWVFMLSAGYRF